MSTLFSSLPIESGTTQLQNHEDQLLPASKRLKPNPTTPEEVPPATPQQLAGSDSVADALIRITEHISSKKKFPKASQLLRQLIVEDKIGQEHSKLVFEVH